MYFRVVDDDDDDDDDDYDDDDDDKEARKGTRSCTLDVCYVGV